MIKRTSLYEAIVTEIKKYIQENKLKPGDKLPKQDELCKVLGVSRTSLREALRTLQAVDIIEIKNGKGIYVKERTSLKLEATVDLENQKKSILEMIEIRRSVEGLAVKLAAERATEDEIIEMEKNLVSMEVKTKRGECEPDEDKAFHTAIYRASKNQILIELIENLYKVFDFMWQNPLGIGNAMNEFKYHKDMFTYIKDRQPSKAEKAFLKIMDAEELMIKNV